MIKYIRCVISSCYFLLFFARRIHLALTKLLPFPAQHKIYYSILQDTLMRKKGEGTRLRTYFRKYRRISSWRTKCRRMIISGLYTSQARMKSYRYLKKAKYVRGTCASSQNHVSVKHSHNFERNLK